MKVNSKRLRIERFFVSSFSTVFCLFGGDFLMPIKKFLFSFNIQLCLRSISIVGRVRILAITSLLFMLIASILMTELCNEDEYFVAKEAESRSDVRQCHFIAFWATFHEKFLSLLSSGFHAASFARILLLATFDIHNYIHAKSG